MDILIGLLMKALTIIGLTTGLRFVGQRAGSRWGGLVLGLPASTAAGLLFIACDQGAAVAGETAEGGLLGLAAAICLALAYAAALARGWSLPAALAGSVAAYLAAALLVSPLRQVPLVAKVAGMAAFVLLAARLARRLPVSAGAAALVVPSRLRSFAVRTAVPVVCLLGVLSVSAAVGPFWAGLLVTFPSTSVAVLMVTQLEAGPGKAVETAAAFPLGNLAMIGFVVVFRYVCPACGVAAAMAAGYGVALAALIVVQLARLASRRAGPAPGLLDGFRFAVPAAA